MLSPREPVQSPGRRLSFAGGIIPRKKSSASMMAIASRSSVQTAEARSSSSSQVLLRCPQRSRRPHHGQKSLLCTRLCNDVSRRFVAAGTNAGQGILSPPKPPAHIHLKFLLDLQGSAEVRLAQGRGLIEADVAGWEVGLALPIRGLPFMSASQRSAG
jgi:hypothetical protein